MSELFARGRDGTRLYVRHRGSARAGAAVTSVLCDGILCDGFIWKYLWDDLAEQTKVAHWHYRGHGRSAPPEDPDRVDIAANAADLDCVRTEIGDGPVVLFGHSMGCQVALEGYRLRRADVRGIVLLCGSFGRVTETFHGTNILAQLLPKIMKVVQTRPELTRAIWSRVPADLSLKLALFMNEVDARTINPDDMLPYLKHMTHVDFPMFLRMLQSAGDHTAEDLLPSVDVPVLVVAGDRDTFTPPHLAEFMAKTMPKAELMMIEGGTHVAPLEHHEAVDERIRAFLEEKVGV